MVLFHARLVHVHVQRIEIALGDIVGAGWHQWAFIVAVAGLGSWGSGWVAGCGADVAPDGFARAAVETIAGGFGDRVEPVVADGLVGGDNDIVSLTWKILVWISNVLFIGLGAYRLRGEPNSWCRVRWQ